MRFSRVKRGTTPQTAVLIQSYESSELGEIIRDMNKISSNFIAEMVVKTLGAELKGTPGSWPKGLEVAEDLLAEECSLPGAPLLDSHGLTVSSYLTLLRYVKLERG